MPELPEVETVVRDLRPLLTGRRIASITVSRHSLRRPWIQGWKRLLVGRSVADVRRRGKWILLALDDEQQVVVHLGMTGQLTVLSAGEPLASHTHLVVALDGGRDQLRYRDIRRFGSVTRVASCSDLERFFQKVGLGPEPFDLDSDYWHERLAATERCLKAVLLDQRVVAGVGNIYADESLFQARLHPAQRGQATTPVEAGRLRRAIVQVLNRAITQRGSSIRNYVGGSGLKGRYQEEFRVYGRYGQPCPRCRASIERIRLAGRSTHYCPSCQLRGDV